MRAVDLFAGFGGFTLGAEIAGVSVVWAANHWRVAVDTHAANHPNVEHSCQDLRQADWSLLPEFDILLASPACPGSSRAGQPGRQASRVRYKHAQLRSLAWSVADCVEVTRPRAFLVENVPEMRSWNKYDLWLESLRRDGYTITESIQRATWFGVPQRRDRLFIAGSLRGPVTLDGLVREDEPAFGPCVQWDAADRWLDYENASKAIRGRMDRARARHGDRCLFQLVTGHSGIPLSESIRTVTTKDQWRVMDYPRYRPLTIRETARAMGFPDTYDVGDIGRTDAVKGFGNAVCPPKAAALVARTAEAA